jgi:hypothetical protein
MLCWGGQEARRPGASELYKQATVLVVAFLLYHKIPFGRLVRLSLFRHTCLAMIYY